MAFIPNSGIDYDKAFEMSDFVLLTNNIDSYVDTTVSPSAYGLDLTIPFVSGFLLENSINLDWSVIRPVTKDVISNIVTDAGFSGFKVNFYDINRNLIFSSLNSFLDTSYSVENSDLLDLFSNITGEQNVNSLNEFFIDIVSTDIQGRTSTGIALINFETPQVSISGYTINNKVIINLRYENRKSIKNLDLFVTTGSLFDVKSTDCLYKASYSQETSDSVTIPILTPNYFEANVVNNPYYVHFVPYGYFCSGQKIVSSGIKPYSYDLMALPSTIYNLTGCVSSNLNKTDKNLNLEAFVAWSAVNSSQDCVFHIAVEESGNNKKIYKY